MTDDSPPDWERICLGFLAAWDDAPGNDATEAVDLGYKFAETIRTARDAYLGGGGTPLSQENEYLRYLLRQAIRLLGDVPEGRRLLQELLRVSQREPFTDLAWAEAIDDWADSATFAELQVTQQRVLEIFDRQMKKRTTVDTLWQRFADATSTRAAVASANDHPPPGEIERFGPIVKLDPASFAEDPR